MKHLPLLIVLGGTTLCATTGAAMIATFDSLAEGTTYDAVTDGGIMFTALHTNQGNGYTNFTVEAGNALDLGPQFSAPNTMGFGGYAPGSGVAFGGFKDFTFETIMQARTASLDFWTLPANYTGNTITLEGFLGSSVVESVSITYHNFGIEHFSLSLPTALYDRFRLVSSGSQLNGDSLTLIDNVTVESVPEPLTGATFAIAFLALVRRRATNCIKN